MQEIIELTKDLIRFKSMHSQPAEINKCAASIEAYLQKHGITYKRIDHNGIPSILISRSNGYVPVLLMSHIDVVEGPDNLFEPYEKGGNLYGRGSKDDKYAVALSLVLLKEFLPRIKNQADLPFGVLITGDEEIGGANGARKALAELKTDFCIALDGGSLAKIVIKEKGILRLKLIARGKSAHGARPWLGENAIEKLFADYQVLKAQFQESTPDHWHRTLNFSRIRAGNSINQVPDYAEAVFDIRFTEHDDMGAVVETIRHAIQGELLVEKKDPLFIGGQSPYLDLLLDIAQDTSTGFEHGASDARFLSDHGIPGIVWGPDGDQSQHTSDEHVSIASVSELYRLLDTFLQKINEARPDS
jgi:succinyl-diaminopimelate desuccinylase